MRGVRARLRAMVCLTLVLALCFSLAVVQPAYAGDVTVKDALDTPLTIYNNSFEGWLSASAHDGVDMAQNVDIADSQIAYFYIEVTGPGTLSWWLKTDTENNFDWFRIYDSSVLQPAYNRSGFNAWARYTYAVPAGSHQIRFAYEKDISIDSGADSVYIDALDYANDPPVGRVDGAHLAGNAVPLISASPEAEARTGFSVGISDNVAAIASNWDDTTQTNAGSVTLYRRVNGEWVSDQLITAPDETASSYLGTDMALDSGLLACASATGKIYVYADTGSDFVPYGATITAPAGASDFGGSVAVSNGTIVTGARYAGDDLQGRVYVYTYVGGAWTLQQTIDAPDVGSRDFFGTSVDIEGDTLIIGSPGHDHAGAPGGAAYIYTRSGGVWTLASELNHPGGTASTDDGFSDFGWSVGVSNGTAVAGARTRHALYVYTRPDGAWALTDILRRPTEPAGSSDYGSHVALDGDTILSGDPYYDLSAHGGTVFAYQRSNGSFFDLVEQLHSGVPATFGGYGGWVAIDGPQFVVGESYWDGPAGSNQGRAVVYDGAYYRVPSGGTLTVGPAMGVCANDIEPEGDTVSVYTFEPPTSGAIDFISPQGGFGYTAVDPSPAEVEWGYTPMDSLSALGAVTDAYITVAPAPSGDPVFNDGDYYTNSAAVPVTVDLGNVRMFRTNIDGGPWSAWQWRGDLTEADLDLGALADGTHTLWIEFTGSGGTRSFHETVLLDTVDPVPVIGAHGTLNPGGTVHVSATDTGSGVDRICYQVEGGPEVWVDADEADVVFPAAGVFDMSLKAVDLAGNESVIVTDEITVTPLGLTVTKVEGANRVGTAIAASVKAFPTAGSVETVVIATSMNWPDALGGAALAGAVDGPILLTNPTSLPAEVGTEIGRLGATKAIILGGPSAVGTAVETALKTRLGAANVERLAGAGRYDTARLIAAKTVDVLEAGPGFNGTAFLATGLNFPDALGASPLAAANGWPIYLVNPATGADATLVAAMKADGVNDVLVLGGPTVVSEKVRTDVAAKLPASTQRLSGDNRYDTARVVAGFGVAEAGLGWDKLAIATGTNFPDALAGGVLQGKSGSVMLLTPSTSLNSGVASTLSANKLTIHEVRFLGGTSAVSQKVRDAVGSALK